jgi:hypothetical protein
VGGGRELGRTGVFRFVFFSEGSDENVLELDRCDSCTVLVSDTKTTKLYTLKM